MLESALKQGSFIAASLLVPGLQIDCVVATSCMLTKSWIGFPAPAQALYREVKLMFHYQAEYLNTVKSVVHSSIVVVLADL